MANRAMRRDNYRHRQRAKPRRLSRGRQQWDEVTGFMAYEDDLAEDAYGNLVDSRHPENFDNPDTYQGAERQP